MRRVMVRRALLTVIVIAAVAAIAVAVTGGFDVRVASVRIRSRDPLRPLLAALVLLGIYGSLFNADLVDRAAGLTRTIGRYAGWFAVAAALALAAVSVRYATFAASGPDSYGYVSQAYWWLDGQIVQPQPIAAAFAWKHADAALAPLGYRPAPGRHGIVPIYAPGLPIMMAVAAAVAGPCGPFIIVPICCAALVAATFALGRRIGGPLVGLASALLVALSPTVLFMAMWPMSDVPVAALWTIALVLALRPRVRDAAFAGCVAALALLVRPNLPLVPAAIVLVLLFAASRRHALAFALCAAPAAIFIAILYTWWYGAPWKSGYGGVGQLFGLVHVWENTRGYALSLWRTQTALICLAVLPLAGIAPKLDRKTRGLAAAVIVATIASYLFYFHWDEWWYLRFLLPMIPAATVCAVAALAAMGRRLRAPWGAVACAVIVFMVGWTELSFASGEGVFGRLRWLEHRYIDIADYVDRTLPANAAIISMQHSGTLRFYAGRLTVRYEWLGAQLARAPRDLGRAGFHPYAVLEDWELPDVRRRLGLPENAPMPWPLLARMTDPMGISIFDLAPHARPGVPVVIRSTTARSCRYPREVPVTRSPSVRQSSTPASLLVRSGAGG